MDERTGFAVVGVVDFATALSLFEIILVAAVVAVTVVVVVVFFFVFAVV